MAVEGQNVYLTLMYKDENARQHKIYTVEMLDLMQSKMTSTTVGLLVVLILDIKDVGFPRQMKMNKRTQILYNRFQFPAMLYHAWKEDSR